MKYVLVIVFGYGLYGGTPTAVTTIPGYATFEDCSKVSAFITKMPQTPGDPVSANMLPQAAFCVRGP